MSHPPGAVLELAIDAWTQGFRALWRMPVLALSALGVMIAIEIALSLIGVGMITQPAPTQGEGLLRLIHTALDLAVIASVLIAVHRFVVLDETADRPVWRLPASFLRFAFWLLLIQTGLSLAVLLIALLASLISVALASVVSFCGSIATVVIQLRLLLLFPGIAVDANAVDRHSAAEDAKGHLWRFWWVTFVTFLIPLVVFMLVFGGIAATGSAGGVASTPPVVWMVVVSAAYLLMTSAGAVLASRFFQIYGRHALMSDETVVMRSHPSS